MFVSVCLFLILIVIEGFIRNLVFKIQKVEHLVEKRKGLHALILSFLLLSMHFHWFHTLPELLDFVLNPLKVDCEEMLQFQQCDMWLDFNSLNFCKIRELEFHHSIENSPTCTLRCFKTLLYSFLIEMVYKEKILAF